MTAPIIYIGRGNPVSLKSRENTIWPCICSCVHVPPLDVARGLYLGIQCMIHLKYIDAY